MATPAELRAHLAARLADYMIPAFFMPLEALPLTPNGKVDRKSLRDSGPGGQASAAYQAPRTQGERTFAGLWQNRSRPSGWSLKAIQFIARLRQETGAWLELIDVFRRPDVAGLAGLAAQRALEDSPPTPAEGREAVAVSPMTDEELEMLND